MNIYNNEYNDELNDEDESVGAKETFESKVIEDFIVEEENIEQMKISTRWNDISLFR